MEQQPDVNYAYPPDHTAPSPPPPSDDSPAIVMRITSGNFVITDSKDNLLFKAKEPLFSLHDRRMLLDANETPVMTLREKIVSMHHRWQIFRGDSKDPSELLFTVKRTSMIQLKAKLDVFLAQNKEEILCDFKVKGAWFDRSCVVYVGESDTIVAQMEEKPTTLSALFGKDHFSVTVNPNFDYAFVAALIVILDDIYHEIINITRAIDVGTTILQIAAA